MRQSYLFTKTRKHAPSDEVAKNAQLLIRAGFIHKEMAGVYTFLPLGLRTLNRINTIIREEMNAIGGTEVLLSALQDKKVWEATDRWDENVVDVWFKTTLHNGAKLGLAFTHEEVITNMMRDHIASYRDLPRYVYQIQTKFRNEVRAKSGIMRTREFPMKDLYSFTEDTVTLDAFYEKVEDAYTRIFHRCGIGDRTYKTFASGGSFSKYSHEFQTVSDAGEDIIYVDTRQGIAINKEVYTPDVRNDLKVNADDVVEKKSIEVGNIFKLGTKFSEALNLTYKDAGGNVKPVVMGSYGIGPSRLMGTIAEVCSDEKGLVWPFEVAPFVVHIIRIGDDERTATQTETLYQRLSDSHIDTLYDDRDIRAGEKFADSDLMGLPIRVVVSPNTLNKGGVEVTTRADGKTRIQDTEAFIAELKEKYEIT